MSIIDKLIEVQNLDKKTEELKTVISILKEGPPLKKECQEKESEVIHIKKEFLKKQSELMSKNLDLQDNLDRQKDIDFKISSGKIKNPKELSIADKELKTLKQRQDKIEDEILILEEDIQTIQKNIKETESYLMQKKPEKKEEEKKCEEKINQLQEELTSSLNKKDDYLKQIELNILTKYQDLCANYEMPIAKIEDGACSECYISLSTGLTDRVKKGADLILCESCGRILCIDNNNKK